VTQSASTDSSFSQVFLCKPCCTKAAPDLDPYQTPRVEFVVDEQKYGDLPAKTIENSNAMSDRFVRAQPVVPTMDFGCLGSHKAVPQKAVSQKPYYGSDARENTWSESATLGKSLDAAQSSKLPSLPSPSKAAKLKLVFEPGSAGIGADWTIGLVTIVAEGEQAHRLGVRVGMRILTVDGQPYTESRFDAARDGTESYEVAFAIKSARKAG